jgi:hypothetical protein
MRDIDYLEKSSLKDEPKTRKTLFVCIFVLGGRLCSKPDSFNWRTNYIYSAVQLQSLLRSSHRMRNRSDSYIYPQSPKNKIPFQRRTFLFSKKIRTTLLPPSCTSTRMILRLYRIPSPSDDQHPCLLPYHDDTWIPILAHGAVEAFVSDRESVPGEN